METNKILCFRAFDFRDRFQQPFATFTEALEALQSDDAYLPENGQIICYLHNGVQIEIPTNFFIKQKALFQSVEEAKAWLCQRDQDIEDTMPGSWLGYFGDTYPNPKLPLDARVKAVMIYRYDVLISSEENTAVQMKVESFLNKKLKALCGNSNETL